MPITLLNKIFCKPSSRSFFRNSQRASILKNTTRPGDGSEWGEEIDFLCRWNGICIFLGVVIFIFYFILHVFNRGRIVLQNAKWLSLPRAIAAGIM